MENIVFTVIEDTPRVPMPVPERCVQMDFVSLFQDILSSVKYTSLTKLN